MQACPGIRASTACRPPPIPFSMRGQAGRNHLNEEITPLLPTRIGEGIDQITIKTQNPKCRLYWCLTEFIAWRYSQSCWYFLPLLWTSAPQPSHWFIYPPSLLRVNKYRGTCTHTVCNGGGGWRGSGASDRQTPAAKYLYWSLKKTDMSCRYGVFFERRSIASGILLGIVVLWRAGRGGEYCVRLRRGVGALPDNQMTEKQWIKLSEEGGGISGFFSAKGSPLQKL